MHEKTPTEILISIAKVLDELKIDYYITGGFAVSVWGRPRFTADIDLIIKMTHLQKNDFSQKIAKLFPKGYIDQDQIDTALARQGEFNFIEPETGLKVDFWITKNDAFDKLCFNNLIVKDIGYKVKFISPEDLILSKLIWFSETNSDRHTEDAQTVLDISKIDLKYLKAQVIKLKLEKEFAALNVKA